MRVMITTLDLVNPRRSHHGVASIIRHGHQMKNRVEIELPQKKACMEKTHYLTVQPCIFLVLCLQCEMSTRIKHKKSATYPEDRSRLSEYGTLQELEMKPHLS